MQLFILKPSKNQKLLIGFLYLLVAVMLSLLPLNFLLKVVLVLVLSLFFGYELLNINLKFEKSVLAIRHQNDNWQVKLKKSWLEVKLINQVFISDIFLLLVFKTKGDKYYSAISQDMLDGELFRRLRIIARVGG